MTQEYIRLLARKFFEGTASEEEKQLLHEWYDRLADDQSPEIVATPKAEDAAEVRDRMHANLRSRQQQHKPSKRFGWIQRFTTWSSAAAAIVLIGFWLWTHERKPATGDVRLVTAPLGKTVRVNLPDGSHIWLNAGSALSYPVAFKGKTREVVLREGQAFFDIAHDKAKPFIVHAKTLDITVLGTSFDVKAYKNDPDIKVTVKTGKVGVQVRDNPGQPALMLLPAEQAVVPEKTQKIQVNEISKPAIAPWKDNRMVFEDELLVEVLHALERKYNQHIVIEKPGLSAEKISLTLDDQPMNDVLKVLGFSKNFNYSQLNDSTIVIR
ncbi:ferric-dicitrate binding protein FerR (iron transport regulator) [Dyadobacter sp. BE34]|uniref:Ferric-dicitrate binding protein FerR (Iron transport regulator) n=1 Tax=Dyadobacter fermentans TaxID=94254 RepID=A0ABU1R066_9BACT|nr:MULTISPECIES: FecR domain-containing protein [Dyadobacter]MDR6806803.1 ferric-dicitrate binding protein FerR (iron transport regulator) [Dyadobacter fermentans]MDR7044545.1 ferric-dicitrate binding protein FerR (iron transport regulator) [Dyadobacter sp. BE242]MDR7198855.1 ferric-dicitrate binding protein FerR (iron transport regulator) [Dyadobacter sp. BE34]MDR7216817.1 ferric-dicitrate binding protein FerR (iron transport regulator) [Dyadobacter sp. BE31]MDR7263657.1 ferric-dicitrate bind